MRGVIVAILLFGFSQAAVAQKTPEKTVPSDQRALRPDLPTRVFPIKYADINALYNLLLTFEVEMRRESGLNAIAVHGPATVLTAVEEVIKRFDVPANAPKNVELTVYMVLGAPAGEPDSIPAAIRPAVDQLRNVMAYKSYRVIDTLIGRGKEGDSIHLPGIVSDLTENKVPSTFDFETRPRVGGDAAEPVVKCENLRFGVSIRSGQLAGSTMVINTSVDIKKGQQVVVGKATLPDRAMILIVSAKIVD